MSPRLPSPFAPPPDRKAPKVKRDSDQEIAEKHYVRARDRGCVAARAVAATGDLRLLELGLACDGPLDVDHVRASGGLGMKSETHRRNMVVLCRHHHRAKTEYGKTWRPLLLAYLDRVEPMT